MNTIQLPTGLNVPVSAAYPNNWDVQQAISDIYNSFGVMTYCKPKTLRKFGETLNADNGADTTVAKFQGSVINETFSTTNDITHIVSDDENDVQSLEIQGHYYDSNFRKIFTVQSVTLNGLTPVELSRSLCRVTRYKVNKVSYGNEPLDIAGNIAVYSAAGVTVTNGVVQTDAKVKLYGDTNQSRKCASSISYYDFFVINEVSINAKKASGSTALIDYDVEYREEGGVWLPMGLEGSLRTASSNVDIIQGSPYLFIVPRNSDFRLIVNSSADDIPVKGFVNGFLLNDITDPNSSLSVDLKNKILTSMRNPN